MKHLLTGVAVAAALAIAAPGWAQNPSGGNGMGMPGPNPGGGGGLTPYSGGGTVAPSATAPGRMPLGGKKTSSRGGNLPPGAPAAASPASTSAMPPMHHAVRHAKAMHGFHKGMAHKAALTGDTTAQLNREELARLQAGAPPSPPMAAPPPPMSNPSGGNSMGMPGPNAGGPGLSPYSGGAGGGGLGR
jgi:hypothetical protein